MAYGQNITVPDYANAQGQTPSERWRFSVLNDMMLAIDHPGIDYNDNINDTMEGQHALRIFTDVMYEIESEGWEFNTLKDFTVTLDEQGKYQFGVTEAMPLGCLYVFSVVSSDEDLFVDQNGSLRSRDLTLSNDGLTIGSPGTEITFTQIVVEIWAQMHFALTQYVAAAAITRFQALMVGDSTKHTYTTEDLRQKYVDARRDEVRSGKYNILTSDFGTQVNR